MIDKNNLFFKKHFGQDNDFKVSEGLKPVLMVKPFKFLFGQLSKC